MVSYDPGGIRIFPKEVIHTDMATGLEVRKGRLPLQVVKKYRSPLGGLNEVQKARGFGKAVLSKDSNHAKQETGVADARLNPPEAASVKHLSSEEENTCTIH